MAGKVKKKNYLGERIFKISQETDRLATYADVKELCRDELDKLMKYLKRKPTPKRMQKMKEIMVAISEKLKGYGLYVSIEANQLDVAFQIADDVQDRNVPKPTQKMEVLGKDGGLIKHGIVVLPAIEKANGKEKKEK